MSEIPYKHTFLYKLLMFPSYRIYRHLLIILCVAVIAAEQTVSIYEDALEELGGYVYLVLLGELLGYLFAGYVNFYVLIPRFLLQKKFGKYLLSLFVVALGVIGLQYVHEYVVHDSFALSPNQISYLYDGPVGALFLGQMLILPFSLLGIAMAKMLKYWILKNQQVKELEKAHLKTEVEKLKEQVNPWFLCNILNRVGILAPKEPVKASEMIILLSRLLRYQLYDGEQRKVLVSSELQFLINYLKLEQLYSGKIEYEIISEGELQYTLLPPLILFPFVQHTVKNIYRNEHITPIRIVLKQIEDQFIFCIHAKIGKEPEEADFISVNHRLQLLFKEKYTLQWVGNKNHPSPLD
ncbi:MAG: histidine kinase [Tannerellaceae bacterium]|nr:histidine kinase [Tannerellaceae bacterium]